MSNFFVIDAGFHWAAVVIYILAIIGNTYGVLFQNRKAEKLSYIVVILGLLVHGTAIIYRWSAAGHGPYMARYEVLSSNAWVILFLFLVFARLWPKIRPASLFVYPAVFILLGIGQFMNQEIRNPAPTLDSFWLVIHVAFYKIALGTILIALALSILFLLKKRTKMALVERIPEPTVLDAYAYRFAGFGFIFWAIAMLSGSVWAYESWGRFWAWDPIETWSLLTWLFFALYLHLRRFFGWKEEKAAVLFILCFVLSTVCVFLIPIIVPSAHTEYFK